MPYRRLPVALLSLIVLSGLVTPTSGDDKKPDDKKEDKGVLRWKFKKDTPFYQTIKTTTTQKMTVMNNDVSQTQDQEFEFEWTPTDVKDTSVTLKQKITAVKMTIDIGNQKITYDSTKQTDSNHPLNEFFKALKDSEFSLTLSLETMKVTGDIKGRADFVEKLAKTNQAMKPLLEQILSDDALKQMAEPTFGVVPVAEDFQDKKMQPAEKDKTAWKRKTTLKMGPIGDYENNYEYKYLGKGTEKDEDKLDVIEVKTSLMYTAPKADTPAGGALPFKIKSAKLESKNAKGKVYFNNDTGRVEKSDMSVELDGTLNIEIGGQSTEVKLSQTQTSKTSMSDKSGVATK